MPREATPRQRCASTSTASACMLPCAAALTTARRWSNCAATSPASLWPPNACKPSPPFRWYSSSRPLARQDHTPGHVDAGVRAAAGSARVTATTAPTSDCFKAVNLGNRMPGLGRIKPTKACRTGRSSPLLRRRLQSGRDPYWRSRPLPVLAYHRRSAPSRGQTQRRFASVTPTTAIVPPTSMEARMSSPRSTAESITPKAGTRFVNTAVRDGPTARMPS